MNIQSFFDHCDKLMIKWINKDDSLKSEDAFLAIQTGGKGLLNEKYFGTMPEPFWGNPDCCSVVMINLNPAYKEGHEDLFSREKAKELLTDGYSAFAKSFSILNDDSYNPEGKVWWEGRKRYLDRLVNAYPGKTNPEDSRLPFAIELCPWQTASWGETKIDIGGKHKERLKNHIHKYVLAPALYAISKSQVNFAVGIGLPIIKALLDYGFNIEKSWGPDTEDPRYMYDNSLPKNFPTTLKKGRTEETPAEVFYKLLAKEDLRVLCIRMSGNNKTPREDFRNNVEPEILNYIAKHKWNR